MAVKVKGIETAEREPSVGRENDTESLLRAELIQQIRTQGAMSFKDFMAAALYHPVFGYYSRQERAVGKKGDFYTSVSVGSVFGELLADWIAQAWETAGGGAPVEVVEQGAHQGHLALDILGVLERDYPRCFQKLTYHAIDHAAGVHPFPPLLEAHRQRVRWSPALPEPSGNTFRLVIANELIDAFPVHRVRWDGTGWQEIQVIVGESDEFCETAVGISELALEQACSSILTTGIDPGYTTEINLAMLDWAKQLAQLMSSGDLALLFDYGFLEEDYYAPHRREGTLQAYSGHRRNKDLLAKPGAQDLTAHVNFTRLNEAAERNGFRIAQMTDQHHFLTRLATPRLLAWERDAKACQSSTGRQWIRQFQQLTHPGLMGQAFKVIEWERLN